MKDLCCFCVKTDNFEYPSKSFRKSLRLCNRFNLMGISSKIIFKF